MKQHLLPLLLLITTTILSSNAFTKNIIKDEYALRHYFHPNNEPKGLYIVNFDFFNTQPGYDFFYTLTYRIYCPTSTVREITDGKIQPSRTAIQEDRLKYAGQQIIRPIVKTICSNKG